MINLRNVYKVYENGVQAIDNISMELPERGMVAIVGSSGCGKSTLLNLLSNNDSPTKGQMLLEDREYTDIDRQELIKSFSYIYQDFKLIENMTVYQNILIGHEFVSKDIEYDRVVKVASDIGISEILDQKVFSLSGGQMQRVAIARALVRNPKVVFADEPTGNLDSYNSENVYKILSELARDILVVIVTHDEAISNWADRIITLVDGEIVSDVANVPSFSMSACREGDVQESDEELESILAELGKTSNESSLSEKSLFSQKKGKNKQRKSQGLSSKSIFGLSMALTNKRLVKKTAIILLSVMMIGLMFMSATMMFSTPEKTMVKTMASNDDYSFMYNPIITSSDYTYTNADMEYIDSLFEEKGMTTNHISTGEVISYNFTSSTPIIDDGDMMPVYYSKVAFESLDSAIYTDEPDSLGLDIIIGTKPTASNEIAISKTYYDYMLHYGEFEVSIVDMTQVVEFASEQDIIGKLIEPYNVVIAGVFDDKNNLDKEYLDMDISSITNEDEMEEIAGLIEAEHKQNGSIDLVIKPSNTFNNIQDFTGIDSDYKMSAKGAVSYTDKFLNYIPLNDTTKNYYSGFGFTDNELLAGEIIIDESVLNYLNNYNEADYKVGDAIELSVVEMMTQMNIMFAKTVHDTKEFVIKEVRPSGSMPSDLVVMNEADYDAWIIGDKLSLERYIYSENITASDLEYINSKFTEYIDGASVDMYYNEAYISYSIRECPIDGAASYSFVTLANKYIGIPLFIISIFMVFGLICIFYSDIVKTKTRELLILKSLGLRNKDTIPIYGIFSSLITLAQVTAGAVIGLGFIKLFNLFGSVMSEYATTFNIFYLDYLSLLVTFVAILLLNIAVLFYNVYRLNSKNLRKAFQKAKE